MARCPNCGTDLPKDARFCSSCGAAQVRQAISPDQRPLPFSPWGPPRMAMQPTGPGGAVRAEPVVGPPLSTRQLIGALLIILLILAFIIFYVGGGLERLTRGEGPSESGGYPILGVMGEVVQTGNTGWGVAFSEQPRQINEQPASKGRYYAVGVVVLNQSDAPVRLGQADVALIHDDETRQYRPALVAWGTPEELNAEGGTEEYTLPPREVVAGLMIFDVPVEVNSPRLLVRDVSKSGTEFDGAIDLTREADGALHRK